jgi:tetratricopeptide (TPR) repeat protein/DNA-binding CsgD family transcriptional regulator
MSTLLLVLGFLGVFFPSIEQKSQNQNYYLNKSRIEKLNSLFDIDPDAYNLEFFSLEQQLEKADSKELLIELYLSHGSQLFFLGKYDSAIVVLHKGLLLYSNKSNEALIPINLTLSSLFHYKSNGDSLRYYHTQVSKSISRDSPYYGKYLLNKALISSRSSDFKAAIELIFEAIAIFEKNNDLNELAIAYNNLAFSYERLGDIETHIMYLFKAVELNKKQGNTFHLVMNYNNLGTTHREKDLLDEAIAFYDSAFIQLQKLNDPLPLAQNLMNRGNIYKRKGDAEIAEPLYLEALSICEANNIHYGEMLCKINLGDLYRQKRQYDKSREVLASALDLSLRLKAKREEALVYEKQAWLARDLTDFSTAYHLLDRYHVLNDSLVNESVRKEANALREKFEVERKEKEIIALSKEKLYQQFLIVVLLLGILLLVIVLQFLVNKNRTSRLQLIASQNLNQLKQETLALREKDLMEQTMEKLVLQEHLNTLMEKIKEENFNMVLQKVKTIQTKENPLDRMIDKFRLLHPQFINQLKTDYPQLTQNDLEFCSLIKMNLSTKEIAQLLRITVESVFTKKYRILKKLNLNKETDLNTWVHALSLQKAS